MNNKILVATPPDDTQLDGVRILCVNLTHEQGQLVSAALLKFDNTFINIINYVWNTGDPMSWFLDKKTKSDIIIFNADAETTITGYLAAHSKAYYFGNLKDLEQANNRTIYSINQLLTLLEKVSNNYEPL